MVEGTSAYKLLYHELVAEFLHKLLNLTQDIVLSLKQVLNLLESPVPETFRCPSPYCLFLDSFSSFNESQKHILSFHLRSSFQTHLTRSLSQLPALWQRLGQRVEYEPRLLRFSHEVITVGTNLRNHRVVFASVMQINSLLGIVNSNLDLLGLDDSDLSKFASPVASSSNTPLEAGVSGEIAVSTF